MPSTSASNRVPDADATRGDKAQSLQPAQAMPEAQMGTGGVPPRRIRPRTVLAVLAIVFIAVSAAIVRSRADDTPPRGGHSAAGGVAGVPVVAAKARIDDVAVYLTGLGTVTALKTVTVRSRVDGELTDVAFREGQLVRAGDLLAQIDPRPFQAQLDQALGQRARDEAALADARLDLARYQALIGKDAVPRQQLDTQLATVKQLEAAIQTDQAQIEADTLNLVYARITSPLTGRAGLRLVDPGNIVHATDTTGLVVITQRQPIAVVFTIPQDHLPDVLRQLRTSRALAVEAFDRDLSTRLGVGELTAVDSEIDPTTGTIRLKATFANEDEALFPNQFVNARLHVDTLKQAVVVPAAAVQRGPQQTFAYVVKADETVEARPIVVSLTTGDESVVTKGLTAGDVVVVDGVDRLKTGIRVTARLSDGSSPKGQP